jgi:hypothetical protein
VFEFAPVEQPGQRVVAGLESQLGGGFLDARLHRQVDFLDARRHLVETVFEHAQLAARRDRNAGIQLAGRHVVDRLYQAHDRAGQVVGHGHGEGGQDQHAEEHDEQAALDQFALLVGQFPLSNSTKT